MLWRSACLGGLAALAAVAPASGDESGASFPSLRASAGSDRSTQRAERRVRSIERALIGAGHAAEHAGQRVLARRLAGTRRGAARREADNGLVPPATGGVWSPAVGLPIVAINSVLLHTGKVLVFAYPYRPNVAGSMTPAWGAESDLSEAYVFDPATGESKQVNPPVNPDTGRPAQIFCAGASLLPDGRVLVAGGDVGDPTATVNKGLDTLYVFDPVTETWSFPLENGEQKRMRQGRWYPTQLEMADGRTVIMSGATDDGDPDDNLGINTDVEIFSPDGTLQRLDSLRLDRFDDGTNANGEPAGPDEAPFPGQYPHLFWMPSGHALVAGPRKTDTWRFLPPTPGADDAGWEDVPDLPSFRQWAPAVLMPGSSQVTLFGGADVDDHDVGPAEAVASTTSFDDAVPAAGWADGPAMRVARAFHNAVQLPDGTVAMVGGGVGDRKPNQYYRWEYTDEQRRIERFDPVAGAFTLGNQQAEARTYHSSALLLPDARVLSAGDDINGPGGPGTGARTDTAELWSPPYLFDADGTEAVRPEITAAPAAVGYGQSFVAGVGGDAARAVLVAPGANTHNTDMSQRVVGLGPPERTPCGIRLQAPADANLAPPGYYMLFVLDGDGTPSKARFVRIGPEPQPPSECPPEPTPEPTATAEPSPEPTVDPPPPADPVTITVRARKTTLRRLRRARRLTIWVTADRAAAVRTRLALRRRRLGPARTLTLPARKARRVRLRLSPSGRRRLRGVRRATLVLRVTAVPTVGDPATVTRRLRVR